jgi:hypothetical protein
VGGGNVGQILAARCGHLGIAFDWLTTLAGEADRIIGAGAKISGVTAHEIQSFVQDMGYI